VQALARRVKVLVAPARRRTDGTVEVELSWLLKRLGSEEVASLLVEGGGEVNASFLLQGHAHRVAFFYAPKVIGGRTAPRSVGGDGVARVRDGLRLSEVEWQRIGDDFLLRGRLAQ
jgi:diaminohydroxyphosphoribosylaminopyrimidine deaminase/5-amino-6-(5-phosphoribosylamino)uracil reductase